MNYMAMAGWKTEDMLSGIEGVMNLAVASGEDNESLLSLQCWEKSLCLQAFFWRKKLDKLTIYSYNMANLR